MDLLKLMCGKLLRGLRRREESEGRKSGQVPPKHIDKVCARQLDHQLAIIRKSRGTFGKKILKFSFSINLPCSRLEPIILCKFLFNVNHNNMQKESSLF